MRFAAALIIAALAPAAASAHEVLHRVEPNGAVAVKVYESDGDVADNAIYEVYSPKDSGKPFQVGRTDRNGYLSFVPDAAGGWRIKVTQDDGHGIDLTFQAGPRVGTTAGDPIVPTYLRSAAGLAVITAIFAGLYSLLKRRKAG